MSTEASLSNFLSRITLAPNDNKLNETFSTFQKSYSDQSFFDKIKINRELTQKILLASARVKRMKESSKPLQDLMFRLLQLMHKSLKINPVLSSHLQKLVGDCSLELSLIDQFLTTSFFSSTSRIEYSDLYTLLGSNWEAVDIKSGIEGVNMDALHSISNYFRLINSASNLSFCQQSTLLKESKFVSHAYKIIKDFKKAKKGTLEIPTRELLEKLRKSGDTYYVPVGYSNPHVFFVSLIAIDYNEYGYRLRLLTVDSSPILALGKKPDHYCPEVIWEGVPLEKLLSESLWKPLYEAATLSDEELLGLYSNNIKECLVFDSFHLVPWLTQRLLRQPLVRYVDIDEQHWQDTRKDPNIHRQILVDNFKNNPGIGEEKVICLKPTDKEIKKSFCSARKFVNLLLFDHIPLEKDRLLFKAESRLILLTAAYHSLKNEMSVPLLRGNFIRLIQQSFGKVTAPLEKLMLLNPTEKERDAARTILISLLDLQHRINDYNHESDRITLAIPEPLYPSTHTVHQLKFDGISHQPIKQNVFDTFRFNENADPLPNYAKWTNNCMAEIFQSLENWYHILLDARRKCEPIEIVTLAHRNIFSRLPIPETEKVNNIFSDTPSKLHVDILLLLKKISSLVSAEIYTDKFIPPVFIVDMARVYRFALEIYRHINPNVDQLSISWFPLYQYMESRHSFHMPGELKNTLVELTESFKKISPEGYLRTNQDFKKIPLFYFSWGKFSKDYKNHRSLLGPIHIPQSSIEEALAFAELTASVGLSPADVDYKQQTNDAKWVYSANGVCTLALQEIAQFHTMSIFSTNEAYQKAFTKKSYRNLNRYLGPEDHFLVRPIVYNDLWEYSIDYANYGKFKPHEKQIATGETPFAQRMVSIDNELISSPLSNIPVKRVDQWREQADLIKTLPNRNDQRRTYQFNQATSGPSVLSLDVLLEYFEVRSTLLLNQDYRSYFWALITSAHILESACNSEPLLLERLKKFIATIHQQDSKNLYKSNLNFERLLWLSALCRHLCKLNPQSKLMFSPILENIIHDLQAFAQGKPAEIKLAPHLIASQNHFPMDARLSLVEMARLHLIVGKNPPADPNETLVWLEASEVMQENAQMILNAMLDGDQATRRQLWSLILSPEDVEKVMQRGLQKYRLEIIVKVTAKMNELQLKQAYLERSKNKDLYKLAWGKDAVEKTLAVVTNSLNQFSSELNKIVTSIESAEQILAISSTCILLNISGRMITVDWETGRMGGSESCLPSGKRLPVHLRKHPNLAPLGQLLLRKNALPGKGSRLYWQDIPDLSIDLSNGAAILMLNNCEYRLIPSSQMPSLGLPQQLNEGFSVWTAESPNATWRGIIAAHSLDGTPYPSFAIDQKGRIRPLGGNANLRLGSAGHYPEAEIFSRWGIAQKDVLVWLNENDNVAELHIPLRNGESRFTRIMSLTKGIWKIDGIDVQLESTNEAVPAFAGHPVYLVGKNAQDHQLLLLPGATPYELKERRKQPYEIDWNEILTRGANERIHQYRIMSSGKVEGLTVADNLLLTIWTLYMGHFTEAALLVKRWLTPAGRPYTAEEENILSSLIVKGICQHAMEYDQYPSILSIRLYAILRMARHLKNYPSERRKSKSLSDFAEILIGTTINSRNRREEMGKFLMSKRILGKQLRDTSIEELFSTYDHEAAIRLFLQNDNLSPRVHLESSFSRLLHQRQTQTSSEKDSRNLKMTLTIHGRSNLSCIEAYNRKLNEIADQYAQIIQDDKIPIQRLYRNLVPTDIRFFFDKAYTLIKQGPQTLEEEEAYRAIKHGIEQLDGPKAIDLCLRYLWINSNRFADRIFFPNLVYWLIIKEAYHAKNAGKRLPELPHINRLLEITCQGSGEAVKNFFESILNLNGKDFEKMTKDYLEKWSRVRELRYLTQSNVKPPILKSFEKSLLTPRQSQLTTQIAKWSHLSSVTHTGTQPVSSVKSLSRGIPSSKAGLCWSMQELYKRIFGIWEQSSLSEVNIIQTEGVKPFDWNYPVPNEWSHLPLQELKEKLHSQLEMLTNSREKFQKSLLDIANALPIDENKKIYEFARQIHYAAPLSIDDIIGIALTGEKRFQLPTILYLEAALEEAHLQRAEQSLKLCLEEPNDKEQIQLFKENLFTPHQYKPCTKNLPLMISEYYSDCRLRANPDQANLIDILTSDSSINKGNVIQAIMGSGKTTKIAPAYLQIMLLKGFIPILCVPSSLFRTTLSDFQKMMWDRYRTQVRAFTFDREGCTSDYLYGFAEALLLAKTEPTVFVCATRDLHALQLMLKERHQLIDDMRERLNRFTMDWARTVLPKDFQNIFETVLFYGDWDGAAGIIPSNARSKFQPWLASHENLEKELSPLIEESNLLQSILNLLQNQAALLVDEVAISYDPRNLVSFPIGWQTQANPIAASTACKIYFEWLAPYYEELGLHINMQSLSKESVRQDIYRQIAEKAWLEYNQHVPDLPPLNIFTAYLLSDLEQGRPMQSFIYQMNESQSALIKQFAQEIAFLKYSLTSGLEGALTSTGHVNYGRSKQDPNLYLAIPYQCANVPKENTLFRRPWKTVLMTCQLYSQGWNDPKQTAELLGFLQGVDPTSKEQVIIEAANCVWGPTCFDVDLSSRPELIRLTGELDRARLQPEKTAAAQLLIRTYLQACVFPTQLKLDPSQLTSSPQEIPMIAAKADAMGGTFGFESTWNVRLARVPDKSSDASILKALKEERNQGCHIIPKGAVKSFLKSFKNGDYERYMALIDAGAIFKGLSNEMVAKKLLKIVKGFDCVLFYDEQTSGGARLAVMTAAGKTILEASDKEGVRRGLAQLKLSNPFTFYDQARRIGADLELKDGMALVTFSDTVTQDDLFQSCMRCRHLLDGRHSIAYAVPQEMEGAWTGNKVIEAAESQQKMVESKANFHGICEQLRGEVRATIDRAMRSEADFKMREDIHKDAKTFLMEEQSNDLVKTFASLQGMMRSDVALKKLKENLINVINKVVPSSKNQVEKALDNILLWHQSRGTVLPEWIREGETQDDAVQEVDLSKDQDRTRFMEEEYERMLGTRNPKIEIKWEQFDPQLIRPTPFGAVVSGIKMPTLYYLNDAVNERGFNIPFSDNLLISANLLSTFQGETNCLLTVNQKPVHRMLCVMTKETKLMVLITEGDANNLKELLLKLPADQGRGIYLAEPNGAINQRGCRSEEVINLWREGNLETRSLLLQVIIFQGSALLLSYLPEYEVNNAFNFWINGDTARLTAAKIIFESALDLSPEELLHYRRNQKLRTMFISPQRVDNEYLLDKNKRKAAH